VNYSINFNYCNSKNFKKSDLEGTINQINAKGDLSTRVALIAEIVIFAAARVGLNILLSRFREGEPIILKKIITVGALLATGVYISKVYRKVESFFLKYAIYLREKNTSKLSRGDVVTMEVSYADQSYQGDFNLLFGFFSRGFRTWKDTGLERFKQLSQKEQEKELREDLTQATWIAKKTFLKSCLSFRGKGYSLKASQIRPFY